MKILDRPGVASHRWTAPARASGDSFAPGENDPHVDAMAALKALANSAVQRPNVAWEASLKGFLRTAPAVGPDGTVYVMGSDRTLRAYDWKTGKPQWEMERRGYSGRGEDHYMTPGPDRIYVTTADGEVLALQARGGEPAWLNAVVGPVENPPAQGPDGMLYVAGRGGIMYALRPSDGEREWVALLGRNGYRVSSPAVNDAGKVAVGTAEGFLLAFHTRDGTDAWCLDFREEEGDVVCVYPTAVGRDFVVGTSNGLVCRVSDQGDCVTLHDGGSEESYYAPVQHQETVIAASLTSVIGLRPGQEPWRWSDPKGRSISTPPQLDQDGRLAVALDDGTVQVLDAVTGAPTGRARGADSVSEKPVWGPDGLILTGGWDDKLDQPRLSALITDETEWVRKRAQDEPAAPAQAVSIREESVIVGGIRLKRKRFL